MAELRRELAFKDALSESGIVFTAGQRTRLAKLYAADKPSDATVWLATEIEGLGLKPATPPAAAAPAGAAPAKGKSDTGAPGLAGRMSLPGNVLDAKKSDLEGMSHAEIKKWFEQSTNRSGNPWARSKQ